MHRGQWKVADGSCNWGEGAVVDVSKVPETGRDSDGAGRWGRDELVEEVVVEVDRLFAFDIAALSTWLSVGLIPHARHGGNGV